MFDIVIMLSVLAVASIVGYFLISRVPSLVHTPLMSMTNGISGVTILGALMVFAVKTNLLENVFGMLALVFAAFNIVGGFVVTQRMLRFFKGSTDVQPLGQRGESKARLFSGMG